MYYNVYYLVYIYFTAKSYKQFLSSVFSIHYNFMYIKKSKSKYYVISTQNQKILN